MTEHSAKFDRVKRYYDNGLWTAKMVRNAAKNPKAAPWITEDEVREILGETDNDVADLCERLLTRLETLGADTATERAEFGVLMVDCCMRGCGADLRPKGDVEDGD